MAQCVNGEPVPLPSFHMASILSSCSTPAAKMPPPVTPAASALLVCGAEGEHQRDYGGCNTQPPDWNWPAPSNSGAVTLSYGGGGAQLVQPQQLPPFVSLTPLHPSVYPAAPPPMFHVHYQMPPQSDPLSGFGSPPAVATQSGEGGGSPTDWSAKTPPPSSQEPPSLCHGGAVRTPSRRRMAYTGEQLATLEGIFSEKKYVTSGDRLRISRQVGVTEKQVKMWFQNRRTRHKRENWGFSVHSRKYSRPSS